MTNPTSLEFIDNTTPVISAAWLNGVNDWVYPMYNAGTCVFNGVTVTFSGTNATAITFPATSGTLALAGANTDITSIALQGLCDLSHASAGQIAFPATQNASANANTLDDYEEGTWTPALAFGGASTGITYSTQSGTYTKIGNRVFFEANIVLTSKGSASGVATVTGIGFTSGSKAALTLNTIGISGLGTYDDVLSYLPGSSSTIYFVYTNLSTGSESSLTNSNFGASTQINISGCFNV